MPTNRKITTFPPLPAEGFADLSAVRGAFGRVSTSTIYAWIKRGTFPPATAISPGRVGWHVDLIRAEIAKRAGRRV